MQAALHTVTDVFCIMTDVGETEHIYSAMIISMAISILMAFIEQGDHYEFFRQIYPPGLRANCWQVLPEAWVSQISLKSSQVRLIAPMVPGLGGGGKAG